MKVLVLGLPRTGTQSIAAALSQLGIGPCYHMKEVGANGHAELWLAAMADHWDGGKTWDRAQWDHILAGYEAVADYPPALFASSLLAAYPEATHVVLSTRGPDSTAWMASMRDTLVHAQARRDPEDPKPMARLARRYHAEVWGDDFEGRGRAVYEKHNEDVRKAVEAAEGGGRRLLEYQAGQGWRPLCEFLDVPVPVDADGREMPFPRADDWREYKAMVARERAEAAAAAEEAK